MTRRYTRHDRRGDRLVRGPPNAEEEPGCVRCSRSPTARASPPFARELLGLEVELFATDGTREHLAADGSRGRVRLRPDRRAAARRRPGPDVPPRDLRRHPRPSRRPRAARPARRPRHRPASTSSSSTSSRSRPRSGRGHVGIDEAIEMIDVAGAALLGAAARNAAGVAAVVDPAHYGQLLDEIRELGQVSAELRATGSPPTRSARSPPTTPRSRRTSTRSAATASRAARDGPREGRRPALRREPAPAGGVLPRDDPPLRDARRRDAAPRRAADVQQPARPRRRLPDRGGLHGADGRHRQAHRPGRAGLGGRAGRGLPARARDRPRRVVRRHRRRQPRARRRDRARDRRATRTRRWSPRATPRRRAASSRRRAASSSSPCRRTRPRACATTASRTSTSSASRAACWSRASTPSTSTAASSRS